MPIIINIILFIASFFIANNLVEPEGTFGFLGTILIVAPLVYGVLMTIWTLILKAFL